MAEDIGEYKRGVMSYTAEVDWLNGKPQSNPLFNFPCINAEDECKLIKDFVLRPGLEPFNDCAAPNAYLPKKENKGKKSPWRPADLRTVKVSPG